jgi:hypothetical protein
MRRILSATLALAVVLPLSSASAHAQDEQGDWTITPQRRHGTVDRDTVQLTLLRSPNGMNSFPIALSRLRGLTPEALSGAPAAARFQLASDAGTVSFSGHVGGGTGSGQFDFAAKAGFTEALRQRGVTGEVSEHDLVRLTIVGTTAATVEALLTTLRRYDDGRPSAPELVRFATHEITDRVIADLGDAGLRRLSPETIVRLVNHEVDGRYVGDWRAAGYPALDVEELIRLRNHEVTPDWARQVNDRAGVRLAVEQLVRLRRGR